MSARHKARKLFRYLSLSAGIACALATGVVVASLLATRSDQVAGVAGPGAAAAFFDTSPTLSVVLWVVCTAMAFVIGWMGIRSLGWLIIATLPRTACSEKEPWGDGRGEQLRHALTDYGNRSDVGHLIDEGGRVADDDPTAQPSSTPGVEQQPDSDVQHGDAVPVLSDIVASSEGEVMTDQPTTNECLQVQTEQSSDSGAKLDNEDDCRRSAEDALIGRG